MSDSERAGPQQAAGPSPGTGTATVKRYRRTELDEEEERQKKALLLESEEAEDDEYVTLTMLMFFGDDNAIRLTSSCADILCVPA